MTAIWFNPDDDRIWVEGALQSFAPRTLMAILSGDQITVRLKANQTRNELGPVSYTTITDGAGNGFADAASTLAYLQGVFALRPPVAYSFTQSAAALAWTIAHGLGFRPNVSVVDSAGDLCLADVAWPDDSTVLVTFGAPTAGTAYLS